MEKKISAQVVIINKDGNILCVSRKYDHTKMGMPGGKMEEYDLEEPRLTAVRETFEETGIMINASDLELVFATHKGGRLSYTFLASKYTGEINFNEPHAVEWIGFKSLIDGPFGEYNKQVHDSLLDMRVKFNYR